MDTTTPAAPVITALIDDNSNTILNNKTMDAHPYVNGTGKAGDTITLYDGSKVLGSAVVDANGKWSIKPAMDLAVGLHDLYATEKNLAGTVGPQSAHVALTIDLTNPAPAISLVTDAVGTITGNIPTGGTTDDARPVVSGTGTYGSVVHLYDGKSVIVGSVAVTASGTWSIKPSADLSNGAHNFVAWAKSPAGSWSSASPTWTITVDTSTPAKPVISGLSDDNGTSIPAGSTTADAHPHISGTGKAGDTITVYDGSTKLGTTTVDANGKWDFKPTTDLSNGAHDISATDTNKAGTVSPSSDHIAVTLDTSTPASP